jgi:hypothetical protein
MSKIVAIHRNPTLKEFYARLRARGKPDSKRLPHACVNFSLSSTPWSEAELPSTNYINLF